MKGITCCRKSFLVVISILALVSQIHAEKYIVNAGPGNQLMAGYLGNIGDDNINHWENLGVTWYLNSQGAGDGLTFVQTRNAVTGGFDAWENVSTASIDFTYSGSTTSTWSIDSKNVHYWAESGDPIFDPPYNISSGVFAVTVITFNSDEEFTDVDIVFNGKDHTWKVDGTNYDIQAVSAHEIGHMIGLHHTEVTTSPLPTMYAYYQGIDNRTLEFDDAVGVSFLYRGNLIDNETLSGTDYYRWSLNQYAGKTLTVQSGSTLKFYSGIKLKINGTLIAEGTASNRITFTSVNASPSWGDWGGIYFKDSSVDANCIVKYADIKYATHGIDCYKAEPKIANNIISNNRYGIYYDFVTPNVWIDPTIISNRFESNQWAAIYLTNSTTGIEDNLIQNNNSDGIQVINTSSPALTQNTMKSNGRYGFAASINSTPRFGGAEWDVPGKNIVRNNSQGGLWLLKNAAPFIGSTDSYGGQINGDNSIYNNTGYNIDFNSDYTGGIIKAEYTWWGTTNESIIRSKLDDYTLVDYTPWLSSQPPNSGSSLGKSVGGSLLADSNEQPDTNSIEWLTAWAQDLWAFHMPEKAIHADKVIIRKHPHSQEAHYALIWLVSIHRESNVPGLSSYLLYLAENHVSSGLRKLAMNLLVSSYIHDGEIKLATQTAEDIIKQMPDSEHEYQALYHLFVIYFEEYGDKERATEYLNVIRSKYPGYELTMAAQHMIGEDVDMSLAKGYISEDEEYWLSSNLPERYSLGANYPNPFNPNTTIKYNLPEEAHVHLVVYNLMGREVIRLVDGFVPAGYHQAVWNGKDRRGSAVPSGVYLYRIQANHFSKTEKMVLLK